MIKYTELRWGNAFSYGDNNVLRLDSAPLTQIIGPNGFGKSSIALLLEEVQFNTNSKKIKKGDILNRYVKASKYWIELDFEKDGTKYEIKVERGATTGTVKLLMNGTDVSSHTATGTYKQIELILGYDHKTFSQIVYQSSVSSLEFLTATDTARKKFLIELLNLTSYTKASECFKAIASDMSKHLDSVITKSNTISAWLTKYEKEDLRVRPILEEPEPLTAEASRVTLLRHSLDSIQATNKRITQNNTYKEIFYSTVLPETVIQPPEGSLADLQVNLANKQRKLKEGISLSNKCSGPTTTCPTCSQPMDNSTMFNIVKDFTIARPPLEEEIRLIEVAIKTYKLQASAYLEYSEAVAKWEKYSSLVDTSIPKELLDKAAMEAEIEDLETLIKNTNAAISKIRKSNTVAAEHNSKVKVISAQMVDMRTDLALHASEAIELTAELANLQVLVKAFSTTGLVAYKIECLVKDLESLTNEYLGVLADGRFQLSFKIASSDKLNVVITDNGNDIDIVALSSGERARVNVATLLAIRRLMQTLSNSRTNLLILDETVENLDAEGKEKLVEILLAEDSLNTFLISHGFTHPLLEKVAVVKEHNISRIE